MHFGAHLRPRSKALAASVVLLTAVGAGTLTVAPAYAVNPVTPGNITGLGFDQCEAPSQSAMSAWARSSPFRAAGIYISGNSRGCRTQTNLTPTWVRNQLAAGWHLMPITLGHQASCSTRYPRYGRSIDPTIDPSPTNTYAAARAQGRAEARTAAAVAQQLGIVPGSTLFYDLEGFATSRGSACTLSATWFVHSWTTQLHALGYASGFYSSASSGIRMLDDARVTPGSPFTLPDQLWIADWNGRADTSSSYLRSDGWQPHARVHQYQGGHHETWGGVTIDIDRDYLDLRTPTIPGGTPAPPPPPPPAPAPGPTYTGSSTADPRCTSTSISRLLYRKTGARVGTSSMVPLQCLLKQQHLYPYEVTGAWNIPTRVALHTFQRRMGHTLHSYITRSEWMALITAGTSRTVLRSSAQGPDVVRTQRALNAAGGWQLPVTGVFGAATGNAVRAYQSSVGIRPSGIVGRLTWNALTTGRR